MVVDKDSWGGALLAEQMRVPYLVYSPELLPGMEPRGISGFWSGAVNTGSIFQRTLDALTPAYLSLRLTSQMQDYNRIRWELGLRKIVDMGGVLDDAQRVVCGGLREKTMGKGGYYEGEAVVIEGGIIEAKRSKEKQRIR